MIKHHPNSSYPIRKQPCFLQYTQDRFFYTDLCLLLMKSFIVISDTHHFLHGGCMTNCEPVIMFFKLISHYLVIVHSPYGKGSVFFGRFIYSECVQCFHIRTLYQYLSGHGPDLIQYLSW